MKFDEIVSRLTGISCPVFGLSWEPAEAEVTVARRVITFLEDRRVLYSPYELETPSHCVSSVLQIRHFLTAELQSLDRKTDLAQSMAAMRAACRKFLNQSDDRWDRMIPPSYVESWIFTTALGELRGVFGIHIARLAALHGLDVEDDLATILPSPGDETGEEIA